VGGAPRLLRAADRDALIASGKFFARKFDSDVDELILDQLDEHLAGTTRGRQVEPLSGRDAF
jgi:hypothetical protein